MGPPPTGPVEPVEPVQYPASQQTHTAVLRAAMVCSPMVKLPTTTQRTTLAVAVVVALDKAAPHGTPVERAVTPTPSRAAQAEHSPQNTASSRQTPMSPMVVLVVVAALVTTTMFPVMVAMAVSTEAAAGAQDLATSTMAPQLLEPGLQATRF